MKTSTVVIIGAVALIGLVYAGNLGVAGSVLQYYIYSVDFTGITTGRIMLMVQNPSNASITLNSMAGTITANNTQLGNIGNFQGGIQIPANNQTLVSIDVALSLSAVVGQLFSILTRPNGANQVDFIIAGNANINGGLIVPFTITQTLTM